MSTLRLHSVGQDRILCFDLENRPLAYWYDGQTTSEITAFGWKWHGANEAHTLLLRQDGKFEDENGKRYAYKKAHSFFRDVLCSAGLVYGHNIRRHDLKIFQSWLLRLQLPSLPPIRTTDTLSDYPKRNGLSASLENLAAMYDLPGEKFSMSQPAWEAANQLGKDGMELARKRVVSDVLLQEALRDKLLELKLLKEPRVWRP